MHSRYVTDLASAPIAGATRVAYASRLKQYLIWFDAADVDGSV